MVADKNRIIVAPSILAADIGRLTDEVGEISETGAEWIHIDIMDGTFVPPITFGDNVVRSLKGSTTLFLDTHLMVTAPERHFESLHRAGADRLTIHQETCPHLHRSLQHIRTLGMKNGVAINPGTPVESIYDVLGISDLVLIMTVNPGWGGQPFIASCVDKIRRLAREIERQKLSVCIQVDGGINSVTAQICREAGATSLVAGSAIFGASDRKAAVAGIRGS